MFPVPPSGSFQHDEDNTRTTAHSRDQLIVHVARCASHMGVVFSCASGEFPQLISLLMESFSLGTPVFLTLQN